MIEIRDKDTGVGGISGGGRGEYDHNSLPPYMLHGVHLIAPPPVTRPGDTSSHDTSSHDTSSHNLDHLLYLDTFFSLAVARFFSSSLHLIPRIVFQKHNGGRGTVW